MIVFVFYYNSQCYIHCLLNIHFNTVGSPEEPIIYPNGFGGHLLSLDVNSINSIFVINVSQEVTITYVYMDRCLALT